MHIRNIWFGICSWSWSVGYIVVDRILDIILLIIGQGGHGRDRFKLRGYIGDSCTLRGVIRSRVVGFVFIRFQRFGHRGGSSIGWWRWFIVSLGLIPGYSGVVIF